MRPRMVRCFAIRGPCERCCRRALRFSACGLPLGIHSTSGMRVSKDKRRVRLFKSQGRVKGIRKHHLFAATNVCGVSVLRSRSQDASCLAKRLLGESVTMMTMVAASLTPYDVIGPLVVVLTHALCDNGMPQATMAKCIRVAHQEQSENARGSLSKDRLLWSCQR